MSIPPTAERPKGLSESMIWAAYHLVVPRVYVSSFLERGVGGYVVDGNPPSFFVDPQTAEKLKAEGVHICNGSG